MSAFSPRQLLNRPIIDGRFRPTEDVKLLELKTQLWEAHERCFPVSTVRLYCALACMFFFTLPAQASFIGVYSLAKFTLTNSDLTGGTSGTNGFAISPDGGLSVILTGGNSGSGLAGVTDLVISAVASGLVRFEYSYSSLDSPGFDVSGYLLTGNFFPLSDANGVCNAAPCPGVVQFAVSVGQSFGFRVETMDNTSEPGIFTISGFDAPGSDTPLPEPGNGGPMVVLFAASAAARLWKSRRGNT
jgi:hypothetical protein